MEPATPAQLLFPCIHLQVWPLAEPGELPWSLQRMESMQHMHYQYAGQYWLTQALRNASGVLTDNIDEACLVWVDTYCYQQWWWIQKAIKFRSDWLKGYTHNESHVSNIYAQALDYATTSEQFQKHQGRDYVFQVLCTNLPVKVSKSYSEVQLEMRKSVFCLLPPGDTASSNRLTETILSGCIPVFIGPPWHEMPFHRGEVDWASMAVFLNITEASWLESPDWLFLVWGLYTGTLPSAPSQHVTPAICQGQAVTQVWPLAEPGELPWSLQRMESMQHMHYQYAGQYWLTQALRNASGVLTDNIDEACLVWVDTYCYQQWWIIQRAIRKRDLPGYHQSEIDVQRVYNQALKHIATSEHFQWPTWIWQLPLWDLRDRHFFS
ncbi:hypothetical protein CHLNCDRAFT_55709 [Chlorella variabilis]|uniref:Exostosin GT47 domain-containing protein n=1 Tax=Chlorella variabilis TaxID=554065 RepID=E1ZU93_CHLVA|nr:hypothetical protein CHLNCDRAFT_55709 [Chlorella variabilis]EFN50601.1 hypothetical protein CHLNCDRAFT_55709 [Chlorella variabilis]|eukprot:XP_005842726.1 hypothetical protein CHLNCDRAFT_55709 [Chlorella variabilis]